MTTCSRHIWSLKPYLPNSELLNHWHRSVRSLDTWFYSFWHLKTTRCTSVHCFYVSAPQQNDTSVHGETTEKHKRKLQSPWMPPCPHFHTADSLWKQCKAHNTPSLNIVELHFRDEATAPKALSKPCMQLLLDKKKNFLTIQRLTLNKSSGYHDLRTQLTS